MSDSGFEWFMRNVTVAGVTFWPLRGVNLKEIEQSIVMAEGQRDGALDGLEVAVVFREAFKLIAPSRNRCCI